MSSPKTKVSFKYAIHMWQYRRQLRHMSMISFVVNSGFNIYHMKSGFLGPSVSGKTVSLFTDGIIVLFVAQWVHHMLHLVATLSKQW